MSAPCFDPNCDCCAACSGLVDQHIGTTGATMASPGVVMRWLFIAANCLYLALYIIAADISPLWRATTKPITVNHN